MEKPYLESSCHLTELQDKIRACTACPLRENATMPVPGIGEPTARIMLIGEAPGSTEDETGIPFVGAAGRRLDELLALAGIDKNECFFTNVCRCRPPANRDPRKAEIKACKHWLEEEIKLIQPEVIITLGSVPLSLFCPYGVSKVHGTSFIYDFGGEL